MNTTNILIAILSYVLTSTAYFKALSLMHHKKAWMGLIPFVRAHALADSIKDEKEEISFLGVEMDYFAFGVLCATTDFIRLLSYFNPDFLVNIGIFGLIVLSFYKIIFLGTCLKRIYASIENRSEVETSAIGYLSGLCDIVAVFKILTYPNTEKAKLTY